LPQTSNYHLLPEQTAKENVSGLTAEPRPRQNVRSRRAGSPSISKEKATTTGASRANGMGQPGVLAAIASHDGRSGYERDRLPGLESREPGRVHLVRGRRFLSAVHGRRGPVGRAARGDESRPQVAEGNGQLPEFFRRWGGRLGTGLRAGRGGLPPLQPSA